MPIGEPLILSTPAANGSGWTPDTFVRGLEVGGVDMPRWNAYFGAGQPHPEESDLTQAPGFERHTDLYATGQWLFNEKGDSLSLYGYWGKAWLSPTAEDKPFHRLGLFGTLFVPDGKGVAGYMTGRDETESGDSLDTNGFFLLGE